MVSMPRHFFAPAAGTLKFFLASGEIDFRVRVRETQHRERGNGDFALGACA